MKINTLLAPLAALLVITGFVNTGITLADEHKKADPAKDGATILFDSTSIDASRGWKKETFPEKDGVIDGDATMHIQAHSKASDIVIQEHQDKAWHRDIHIRELDQESLNPPHRSPPLLWADSRKRCVC